MSVAITKPKTGRHSQTITAYLDRYEGDINQAAEAFIRDLPVKELRSRLFLIIRNTMRDSLRSVTEAIEEEVIDNPEVSGSPFEGKTDRERFVGRHFALQDGTWVLWLEATAEQHRIRAAWYRGLASNHIAHARLHEAAAAEIGIHGVTCLGEIT